MPYVWNHVKQHTYIDTKHLENLEDAEASYCVHFTEEELASWVPQ